MNENGTMKLLAVAMTVWPSMTVADDTIRVWHAALADLDEDTALAAMERHIKLSAFEPRPADIRRNVVEALHSGQPTWEDGWQELVATAKTYGRSLDDPGRGYLPPYSIGPLDEHGQAIAGHPDTRSYPGRPAWTGWSSRVVKRAVDTIGYDAFLMADESTYGTLRAQFRDVFTATIESAAVSLRAGNEDMPLIGPETGRQRVEGLNPIGNTLASISMARRAK